MKSVTMYNAELREHPKNKKKLMLSTYLKEGEPEPMSQQDAPASILLDLRKRLTFPSLLSLAKLHMARRRI